MRTGIFSLCLLAATAAPALGLPTDWSFVGSTDGSLPKKRHEAAYVEVDGKFYLMGGRGSRPVDVFDPVAETWTNLGNPPVQMHHFQPVAWGGKIYVLCAFEGGYPNETPIANIWIYDPATNGWTMGPAIPAARNRGAAGAAVYQDKIYIVGGNTHGHNGGYVSWLDSYDPATDTWTALPDAPNARDHFTAAVIGNRLYAAGGRQTEQPNPFLGTIGAVDVYDLTSGLWSNTHEPIPTQRAGTMVVARDQHLIIIGGEAATQAHDEAEALDVETGEWLALPPLIDSRHSGGAVLHNDSIYVAAGAGSNGGAPELSTQERLPLAGLLPSSSTNLLVNGDFDANQDDWIGSGAITLNAQGNIAAPALEIATGTATQEVSGSAQKTYTLSGAYQAFGASGALAIQLQFLNAGGSILGTRTLTPTPSADFKSFALNGTSPLGTATLRVRAEASGTRSLHLDDLVLRETIAQIVRQGTPANPAALAPTATAPTLGQTWSPAIDHADFATQASADFLVLGFLQINAPTSSGTLLVGFGATLFVFAANPGGNLDVTIPNSASLIGASVVAQGASSEFGAIALTNALDVTIQAP